MKRAFIPLLLLLLLSSCSYVTKLYIINYKNLGLNLDETVINIKYIRSNRNQTFKIKHVIKSEGNRKTIILDIANGNIPQKITFKDKTHNYAILFVKKIKKGLIYRFDQDLFLVSFDKNTFDFNSPWMSEAEK